MNQAIYASPERTDPGSSIAAVERLAAARLPSEVWDFIAGGSGAEGALADNRAALDRVRLFPRTLAGVTSPATSTRLFGADLSMPMAIAPVAYQRLLHPEGELAVARAARNAGIPFTVSTLSSQTIETVAETGAQTWFQLYWLHDRSVVKQLLRRAEDAGCSAVVLTVDMPVMGRRLRDIRNRFALPPHIVAANLPIGAASEAHGRAEEDSSIALHTNSAFDPSLSWEDLDRLRDWTTLPLVLKGILHPDDAARAAEHGIDGLVVSNHGGRQFDGAPPSIEALPDVVEAVQGRCSVLFDSGVRSGTDVLRALALGADAVLLGRPVMYGLAADGADGVSRVLALLRDELRSDMSLTGCPDLSAVGRLRTGRTAR
jgi:4-hydroxymandelate oxidase